MSLLLPRAAEGIDYSLYGSEAGPWTITIWKARSRFKGEKVEKHLNWRMKHDIENLFKLSYPGKDIRFQFA